MSWWIKLTGLTLIVIAAIAFGINRWTRVEAWQRCYSSVRGGMTLDQVRQVMDRDEDEPDDRTTEIGEFERSWTFQESGVRITVVFDGNGGLTYIEYGPSYCGVTPLMGKLIPKKAIP